MKINRISSEGQDLPVNNRPAAMTIERILLAYYTNQPLGLTSYLTGDESLEQAHLDVLTDLHQAQHQLEKFRGELHNLLPNYSQKDYRKAYQLGTMVSIMMSVLDELRAEINSFTKPEPREGQT